MHHQAVGNNLQKCLYRENNQEGIFDCFLCGGREEGREGREEGRRGDGQGEGEKRKKNFYFRPKQVRWGVNEETSSLVSATVAMATGFLCCQCRKKKTL